MVFFEIEALGSRRLMMGLMSMKLRLRSILYGSSLASALSEIFSSEFVRIARYCWLRFVMSNFKFTRNTVYKQIRIEGDQP